MLREYIKQLSHLRGGEDNPQSSADSFILHYGKEYVSSPFSEDEYEFILNTLLDMRAIFKMRECFFNAQRMALACPDFIYVEGYALSDLGFPIHHGWVEFNGKVIDMTLRRRLQRRLKGRYEDRIFGDLHGREYIGVPFSEYGIQQRIEKSSSLGSLLYFYEAGFPVLTLDIPTVETLWLANGGAYVTNRAGHDGVPVGDGGVPTPGEVAGDDSPGCPQ